MADRQAYERFRQLLLAIEPLEFSLDVSRIRFAPDFMASREPRVRAAIEHMAALEGGAIANPDEKRQVGHYWLRAPELAPDPAQRRVIEETVARVGAFAADVHAARVRPERAARFENVL